ncbi:hypothetical protein BDM02DRAFT_3113556 [Thelephora ganbajun]|uniref:Uncharacterized protein n=1 Tax=Thelephora ganbajun TaxID=370292 RepID=A0ACB6ZJP1_THEGA|nr:hypothetical protein BDM02DRAFT_3113556 [Thelephora ganbajun]
MPPMSRALVAKLTAEVDALEKRAREVLHEVVTLRNSLRPVNRLPPEVLTSCATFVSDTHPRPIVSLTHVCRYWRKSIVSNPRNWALIATGWKRLVPLCLERTGAVPLAVNITVSDIKSCEDFLESLLPYTSRIGRLRLVGYSSIEATTNDLPSFFDSPISNLTSLELQQIEEPAELFPSTTTSVPPVFQNVSKLESLRLTRTPLYPVLFRIASLRELKLIGYTTLFHFGTFIGFLASNLNLEIVVLDIKFVEGSVWTVPARKVALVRLRHLSITCAKPTDAKGLLSCITFPCGIRCEIFCPQWTLLDSCLPSPPTVQMVLAPITVIKFKVSPREFHAFGNKGFLSFRGAQSTGWGIGPELYLLPTASVREFHMDIASWILSSTALAPLLLQLPALETFVITNATSWSIGTFDWLGKQPSTCASLKTVAFFNCVLNTGVMKELEGAVARRKDSEVAWLYRVVIVNSTGVLPDYTLIQQLRKHVPYVDVRVADELPDLS